MFALYPNLNQYRGQLSYHTISKRWIWLQKRCLGPHNFSYDKVDPTQLVKHASVAHGAHLPSNLENASKSRWRFCSSREKVRKSPWRPPFYFSGSPWFVRETLRILTNTVPRSLFWNCWYVRNGLSPVDTGKYPKKLQCWSVFFDSRSSRRICPIDRRAHGTSQTLSIYVVKWSIHHLCKGW